MTTSPDTIAALKAAAERATPGPWLASARPSSVAGWPVVAPHAMGRSIANVTHAALILDGDRAAVETFNMDSASNAAFIALANPSTVLSLLADLEQAQAEVERLRVKTAKLARCLLPAHMALAECDLVGEPVPDDAVVYHFMGSGASDQVTAGEIRAAIQPDGATG